MIPYGLLAPSGAIPLLSSSYYYCCFFYYFFFFLGAGFMETTRGK